MLTKFRDLYFMMKTSMFKPRLDFKSLEAKTTSFDTYRSSIAAPEHWLIGLGKHYIALFSQLPYRILQFHVYMIICNTLTEKKRLSRQNQSTTHLQVH